MPLSYSHFDFRFLKRDSITWFNSTFENVKCLIMAPLNQANPRVRLNVQFGKDYPTKLYEVRLFPRTCTRTEIIINPPKIWKISMNRSYLDAWTVHGCSNGTLVSRIGVTLFYGLWYLAVQPVPSNKIQFRERFYIPAEPLTS